MRFKISAILFISFFLAFISKAQSWQEPDYYDQKMIVKFKLKSVQIFDEDNLYKSYDFDKNGEVVKTFSQEAEEDDEDEDRDPRLDVGSINDSTDENGRIVIKSFYEEGVRRYTDCFSYDARGNLILTVRTNDSRQTNLLNATIYDSSNNIVEQFYGDFSGNSSVNHSIIKYDQQHRKLLQHDYAYVNQLYQTDSSVYNEQGKITARYIFEYPGGKRRIEDKYMLTYDPSGRLISTIRYNKPEEKVLEKTEYRYDDNGNLLEENRFDQFSGEYPYSKTIFTYNSEGLIREKKFYRSETVMDKDEISPENMMKWEYGFYK